MMRFKLPNWGLSLLVLIPLIFQVNDSKASHAVGIDLSYTCLGNNQYEVTLNFYRDCVGQGAPGTSWYADPTLDMVGCGTTSSIDLDLQSSSQVPAICAQQQGNTTCNGGSFPGVEQYVYTGTITVPSNCPDFRISYRLCCRNSAITNLVSGERMYAEAIINNSNGYCNNSPVFTTLPVPYICSGSPTNYNHGALDVDGDGLIYSLVDPLDNTGTPITHIGGTSANQPIVTSGPFQFDSNTGQMSFTPQGQQNAVVTILVEEYRNGVLVGSTMRDIQVLVLNCSNNNSPNITGVDGTNDYSIQLCSSNTLCFDVLSNDADGDDLTLTYNNGIPGAVFTTSGPVTSPSGTFCWDPTGYSPGVYQFVITVEDDACPIPGRSIQAYSVELIAGNFEITSTQGSDLTCPGDNNGTAVVNFTGGTAPHTIEWSSPPPQNTATATGLTAGTYTVEVTEAGGCSATETVVVTEPDPFLFEFDNTSAVCNGEDNGTITLNVTGGNGGPYTYNWSEPGVGNVTFLDSLSAGAYLVTVTDIDGCTADSNTFVFQPGPLVINLEASSTANYNGSDISCVGASDGEVAVLATGGTEPYIYEWSANANGQATDTVSGLQAGTYFVTVSDSNNCNTGTFISISDPPEIYTSSAVASDYNNQDISCYGAADGAAVALPIGGTPPYTYEWDANAGNQTTDTAVGLSSGTYNVTVYDANLCPIDTSVTLYDPDSLSLEVNSISNFNGYEIPCYGADQGRAIANVSGGTGSRSIQWSNGMQAELIDGLTAGTYTVTISDMNGCFLTDSIEMTEPSAMSLSMNITSDYNGFDISCYGASDGEATADITGGVPGYLYSWFPNQNENDSIANNLEANTWYRVIVSDANECNSVDSILLLEPDSILLDPQVVSDYNGYDISCYGASDGIASVSGVGGTGSYTFEWGDGQTTAQATSLNAGEWTVTATDQNGCLQDSSITLNQPDSISSGLSITSDYNGSAISCFEATDGSLLADASGGVGPYQYTWGSNVTNSSQNTASNLAEDWYQVTIEDQNNCIVVDSIFVDDPDSVLASARGIDVVCAGDINGRGFVEATGGTPSYSYQWDDPNGQIAAEASGLAPGSYNITVTDANGCSDVTSVIIGEPDSLLLSAYKIDPTCFGDDNGTVGVDAVGGVPPYSYQWDDLDNRTMSEIDELYSDTYTVEVTDSTGCLRIAEVVLNNPPELEIDAVATPSEILFGQSTQLNTVVTNNVITPNSGDSYVWSPADGLYCTNCPNPDASPERTTTYTVDYTDSRGCKKSDEVTVEVDIYNRILYIPNAFTPNADENNDVFRVYGEGVEEIVFKVFDRWGEQLFETTDLDAAWDGTHNGNQLKPGVFIYYAKVVYTDGFEEEKEGSVTLIR